MVFRDRETQIRYCFFLPLAIYITLDKILNILRSVSSYKNVYKHIAACIIQVVFKEAELPEGDRDRDADIDIQIDDLFWRFDLIQLWELITLSKWVCCFCAFCCSLKSARSAI